MINLNCGSSRRTQDLQDRSELSNASHKWVGVAVATADTSPEARSSQSPGSTSANIPSSPRQSASTHSPAATVRAFPSVEAASAPSVGALAISATAAVASNTRIAEGVRFGLRTVIDDAAIPCKAKDFIGSRSANMLPVRLASATTNGHVLSIANDMAVVAGCGKGDGRVVVVDKEPGHIAGVQHILRLADSHDTQEGWLNSVCEYSRPVGRQLMQSLRNAEGHTDYSRLKKRIANGEFDFVCLDLSGTDTGTLHRIAPKGYASMYVSNIEMYLAGFLSQETPREERQASLERFRNNVVGLMNENTSLIHGANMVMMDVVEGKNAAEAWHPQAT